MGELEEKLGAILGNPQAMSQIMALAQSLGGNTPEDKPPAQPSPPPPSGAPSSQLLSALFSEAGEPDPRLFRLAAKVMQEYRSNDSDRTALLLALRPFVKEKRYAKLDRAVHLAKLSRLIRAALEALKEGGMDGV